VVASSIRVEPYSLTGDALHLANTQVPIAPPLAVSPARDPVSQGVTGVLGAHSGALSMVVEHSGALRAHGGAVLAQSAASLQAADEDNAATLAAVAGGAAPGAAPSVAAVPAPPAPPEVMLPEIPATTPPPMLPGDVLSKLIHAGPGWSGLLDFADDWRAHAARLEDLADQVVFRGAAIDEHWIDGQQRAGANTREHGYWLRDSADRARTIAAAATDVADHFDTAKNATPTPEEFDAARQEFTAAQARRDPIGVAMAARKYSDLHARAVGAATTYHGGVTDATNRLGTPLQSAPAIARGSGVQPVDNRTFKQDPATPTPDPNDPSRHPVYRNHKRDGTWARKNSGLDGYPEEQEAFDAREQKTGIPIVRQKIRVKVVDPNTGETLVREYDGLEPIPAASLANISGLSTS
jgi:PPE family